MSRPSGNAFKSESKFLSHYQSLDPNVSTLLPFQLPSLTSALDDLSPSLLAYQDTHQDDDPAKNTAVWLADHLFGLEMLV